MNESTFHIGNRWVTWVLALMLIATVPAGASPVVCRVETDRGILPSGTAQTAVIKVTLGAPASPVQLRRPRVNLALVLDRSGSMGGPKMEMAKEAAVEALSRLNRDDIFSLVAYDTEVETIVPARHVLHDESITREIHRIRAGGNTALFGGVSQGAAEVRKHIESDCIHRIILLSDGLANVGPRLPSDLGRLGAGLFKENISVTTVGVGVDYNEDLMAQLAQRSDGNTYFVASASELPDVFREELGDLLNVVARQVHLVVTLPGRVTPVDIIGREGRIRGNRVELTMNQLYGGQEKYALVKVRLPAVASGERMEIARAEVTYDDPYTQARVASSGSASALFSDDVSKVAASANKTVVREYQLNLNALAQEKAIELSDQGKEAEAAETLRQSAETLKALGDRYQDDALIEEAKATQSQAETLKNSGMSKKSRKLLRAKSYQMKNQQKAE